jgi:hypothetical protein
VNQFITNNNEVMPCCTRTACSRTESPPLLKKKKLLYWHSPEPGVAQCLRHCATLVGRSRDRSPVVSMGIFSEATDGTMCPGVDSASKNEYQDTPGDEGGRGVRVTTLPPSLCRKSRRSRSLNLPEPQKPLQACSRKPLPFTDIHHQSQKIKCFGQLFRENENTSQSDYIIQCLTSYRSLSENILCSACYGFQYSSKQSRRKKIIHGIALNN